MDYRRRSLENIAARLGFEFAVTDEFGLSSQLEDFRLASRGRKRIIENILRRQHGLMEYDVKLFDYQFTKWAGSDGEPIHQTVFYLQSQKLVLPEILLQPETIGHKLGELFGFGDIDFVRFPKFSGQYRLTGGDEEYIRHHFTDKVLNYFTMNKGWTLEGVGYYLLLYKKGFLLPPNEIETLYKKGMEVYQLLSDERERLKLFGE